MDKKGLLKSIVARSDVAKNLQFPEANKDSRDRLRVGGAVGVKAEAILRAELMAASGVDVITIDTAHGHSQNVFETLKALKKNKKLQDIDIIAGNIATAEAAKELIALGADAVKVGVGPGSICTTRVVAGVGVPQISAILGPCDTYAYPPKEKGGVNPSATMRPIPRPPPVTRTSGTI